MDNLVPVLGTIGLILIVLEAAIELEIKNEALLEISKLAVLRKTGARGLRSIMENLLVDLMFESPDLKELKKIVINADVVEKKSKPILLYANKENNQRLAVNKT